MNIAKVLAVLEVKRIKDMVGVTHGAHFHQSPTLYLYMISATLLMLLNQQSRGFFGRQRGLDI